MSDVDVLIESYLDRLCEVGGVDVQIEDVDSLQIVFVLDRCSVPEDAVHRKFDIKVKGYFHLRIYWISRDLFRGNVF